MAINNIFTFTLYIVVSVLLIISFVKNRRKTLLSIQRAWKMFITVLPQFVAIQLLIGLLLSVLHPETIQRLIGSQSGFIGMIISSLVGAIVLIPVLIAFPIAAELLKNGAGIAQIVVFISTLTMVGFVTLPLETKYIGKKVARLRNILTYIFSFVTAYVIGMILP